MKKILSILRGKKQTERLSELRSQEIMRALDSALNNVEEQKVLADIRYHEELNNLGDDGVNYKSKINQLIEYKETIINADNTSKLSMRSRTISRARLKTSIHDTMNEIYRITRLDAIQTLAIIAVFILGVFTFLYTLVWIMEDDEKDKSKFNKIVLKLAVYISIPIFLLLFVPSKRDMLMIIGIGGTIEYLKSNDTAKELPDKVIMAIDKLLDDTIEEENE